MLELADSFVQRVLFAFITVLSDQSVKTRALRNKAQVKSNMCPYVLLHTWLLNFLWCITQFTSFYVVFYVYLSIKSNENVVFGILGLTPTHDNSCCTCMSERPLTYFLDENFNSLIKTSYL